MSKPLPLAEQAAGQIAAMITQEHRFHPGDKLPNEMELSEELGVSRITLREAIRMLRARGVVEVRRGVGTFVLTEPGGAEDAAPDAPEFGGASLGELLEACLALEPAAAARAGKDASQEALEAMDALYLRMEQRAAVGKPLLREECAFHDALAAASGNRVFARTLAALHAALYADGTELRESAAFALQDHRAILRCLKDRNPAGARAAALLHVLHLFQSSGIEIQ